MATTVKQKITEAIQKFAKANDDVRKYGSQQKYKQIRDEAFFDYLKLSHFNITPLLGYFFPKYPTLSPFSLKDYPFAHVLYNLNLGSDSSTTIKGSRQISKCISPNMKCKFKNKRDNKEYEMTIEEFFTLVSE